MPARLIGDSFGDFIRQTHAAARQNELDRMIAVERGVRASEVALAFSTMYENAPSYQERLDNKDCEE